MKNPLPFLLLGLLFPALSPGQPDSPSSTQASRLEAWLKRFPEADANGDGVLTREEAMAHRERAKANQPRNRKGPPPTHADIAYGEHERQVFDLWLPEDPKGPVPIHVHFHGGGFVAGDKAGFDPTPFLAAGYAAASANYRFVDGSATLCPTPMEDGARVIQTLRHQAAKWKIDPDRISVGGSSAGAVISLWIGYHDDLAEPGSEDPIARESSRVAFITPLNGPTNLRPSWIRETLGGPRHIHGSLPKMFGTGLDMTEIEKLDRLSASNPWEHLSADDPPTLLVYLGNLEPVPLAEEVSSGHLIHHPHFGVALKARLDDLGIDNAFHPGTDPRGGTLIVDWLRQQAKAPAP